MPFLCYKLERTNALNAYGVSGMLDRRASGLCPQKSIKYRRADDMRIVHVKTEEQLRQAFDVRVEVFVNEQGVPKELEMDEYDESPESCSHFIVLEGDVPIAAGRFKTFEPGVAKMQRIAVLKSFRGKGIGKVLLAEMEEEAKRQNYNQSLLDAQCTAEDFYRKIGYVTESAEPFLDANIWHVRMRKSL